MSNQDGAPPTKQVSKRRSLKKSCFELETFSVSVEKHLLADTGINNMKENLPRVEGKALKKWRKDNLFKKKTIM